MGFVKRNVELEVFLDSIESKWEHLSDQEYRKVLSTLDEFIDNENYWSLHGDEAFKEIETKIPLEGYIFTAPKHKLFSVYESGGENKTIGYSVSNLTRLNREILNQLECVVTNKQLTFACVLNHEWQAMCPELYLEKNA
ncbi:hypothetical protein [Candidatus Thiodiazotropha sp. CDECU1]|uniref:hypothetical protein n=1 Tax=Candidatus Thiodiazotropha sp. CDECU1 TaxID=3065865 RepID=UPI0029317659|nr:hypothetical protein [Candidatus Thiodiazotropha sp. CDECU1]